MRAPTCAILLVIAATSGASSHREAPAVSGQPLADTTDVYAFVVADNPSRVVLAASWIPFQGPESGPLYWQWSDDLRYQIHVDNDGDAVADLTYTLTSSTAPGNDTFLYATGPIIDIDDSTWQRSQRITVTETPAGGTPLVLLDDELTTPGNVGSKSTPDHPRLEAQASYTVDLGGDEVRIYGGQTDDGSFADLQLFDLITLRGNSAPIGYGAGTRDPIDSFSGFNVHTFALELPVDRLTNASPVIGVWATTTDAAGTTQLSRVGAPWFNALVLATSQKDAFNARTPAADPSVYGSLQRRIEDPELGQLLCALYGIPLPGDGNADCRTELDSNPGSGRGDVRDLYLRGLQLAAPYTINTATGAQELPAGFVINRSPGPIAAEMLRLNTSINGDTCAPEPQRLGLLAGDACGFPNGRRPQDDVLDITLQMVAGALYSVLDGRDVGYAYNATLSSILRDGVNANDVGNRDAFPWLAAAQSGQDHVHRNGQLFRSGFE